MTTKKVSVIETENSILEGYFFGKVYPADNCNIVYKYALILEAFLTSDKGQLICFKLKEKGLLAVFRFQT